MNLPPLPFGHSDAALSSGIAETNAILSSTVPSITFLRSDDAKDYHARNATRQIGDIGLAANSATPAHVEVGEAQGWHLGVPCFGIGSIQCDGQTVTLSAGANALLMPNARHTFYRDVSSGVMAHIDSERLRLTSAAITGSDPETFRLNERLHVLDLKSKNGLFAAFQHICGLIDSTRAEHGLAALMGIDDLIYRWIATALGVAPQNVEQRDRQAARLDLLCDMIRAARDRPLTLTELEQASGLSSRTLQYAFKARFGCSPMEWQRRERMAQARQRLVSAGPEETITNLAYAMGFSSSAAFSTLYKRLFDETPSQTLARHRG